MKTLPVIGLVCTFLCVVSFFTVAAQETRDIHKTLPLRSDGVVSLDTYKGSIKVNTWDKDEVEISATVEADGHGRHEEDKVRWTEVIIDDSPGHVDIRSDYHKVENHQNWFRQIFEGDDGSLPFVRYVISMPKNARLEVKDYKSDTRIENLHGDLTLNTYKGNVTGRGLSGGIRLETYKGDVVLTMAELERRVRLETYKGKIDLTVPSNSAFAVETDLGRRADFTNDFDSGSGRHGRYTDTRSGGHDGPVVRVVSEKGEIRILKNASRESRD